MFMIAVSAFFGAVFQELLYWYGLRRQLAGKSVREVLASPGYWLITALMVGASPVITVLMHYDDPHLITLRDALIYGAAAPALFKQALQTAPKPRMRAPKMAALDDATHKLRTDPRLNAYGRFYYSRSGPRHPRISAAGVKEKWKAPQSAGDVHSSVTCISRWAPYNRTRVRSGTAP